MKTFSLLLLVVFISSCGGSDTEQKKLLTDKWWYYVDEGKGTLMDRYFGADGTYKSSGNETGKWEQGGEELSITTSTSWKEKIVSLSEHELKVEWVGNVYTFRDTKAQQ